MRSLALPAGLGVWYSPRSGGFPADGPAIPAPASRSAVAGFAGRGAIALYQPAL